MTAPNFEEFAVATVRELQAALTEFVAKLPGKNGRAVDLQRALGVDKKLGWQLFTFVNAPQPLTEIANVPGAPSMRRILAAGTRRKVSRAVTERAARAFERFETFVSEHGGDRSELVSLASGLSADRDQQHELRVRKSLFRGLAHVWGVQAATYVRTAVLREGAPGPERTEDVLVMIGYVGLQRLRRDAPLAISASVGVLSEPASGKETKRATNADRSRLRQAIGAMQVLEEYSSQPLPEMVPRVDSDGSIETELVFPPSGRAGALTLYTAQHLVGAWSGEQANESLNTVVKLLSETFVCELLVPTGWTDPGTARVGVYGRRGAVERVHELRAIDLLPQRETITYMGAMEVPPAIPGVVDHPGAVANLLGKFGWKGTRYDVYRCTVKYPVLHTMVRIAVDTVKK